VLVGDVRHTCAGLVQMPSILLLDCRPREWGHRCIMEFDMLICTHTYVKPTSPRCVDARKSSSMYCVSFQLKTIVVDDLEYQLCLW
jgi:hypothetical protein